MFQQNFALNMLMQSITLTPSAHRTVIYQPLFLVNPHPHQLLPDVVKITF